MTNLGGQTAGRAISGSFDYKNNGTNGGAQQVYWTAYVSVDAALQLGTDTVIDSGTAGTPRPSHADHRHRALRGHMAWPRRARGI